MPAELGEMDGRNAAAATVGLVNGKKTSHLSPLTSVVVGVPQMTLQQYLSTLPCLRLP